MRALVAQNLAGTSLLRSRARPLLEAHRELDEHGYDAQEHCLALSVLGFAHELQAQAHVDQRRRLGRLSAFESLPAPSARFSTIDVDARVS